MNNKYGKIVEGEITFAPSYFITENGLITNPTDETYKAGGWKKIIHDEPEDLMEGDTLRFVRFEESDEEIHLVYEIEKTLPPQMAAPRKFSKLKLLLELKRLDMWILTRTWLQELGLYDFYLAANEFSEDNEWFQEGKKELQRLSGKTNEEIEAILAASVID